jgi:hypothetical protein
MLSACKDQASGTVDISNARPMSVAISTGRRGSRSTQTPAGNPTISEAIEATAVTRQTSNAEA